MDLKKIIRESLLLEKKKGKKKKSKKKSKGLWANIHAKRKRGEKPAKPGDEDYPDKKNWDRLTKEDISEGLKFHLEKRIPIRENIYRFGSDSYLDLLKEVRSLYFKGELELSKLDEEFILSDIGTKDIYNGEEIWLDTPIMAESLNEAEYNGRKVDVNSPGKSGGKNYVYVKGCLKDPKKVKKLTYGSSMPDRLRDAKRRKAYSARHGCKGLTLSKDKCTKKYWACRKPKDFADTPSWW